MQIRTLNQIINELKEIAKQHYQINSFTVGTLDDFATSGDTRYPAMWVSYENAAIAQRTESYTLSIWIALKYFFASCIDIAGNILLSIS